MSLTPSQKNLVESVPEISTPFSKETIGRLMLLAAANDIDLYTKMCTEICSVGVEVEEEPDVNNLYINRFNREPITFYDTENGLDVYSDIGFLIGTHNGEIEQLKVEVERELGPSAYANAVRIAGGCGGYKSVVTLLNVLKYTVGSVVFRECCLKAKTRVKNAASS